MSDNRWQRVEQIFHRAADLAPEARSAFLDQACGTDQTLRREVESLLVHEAEDGNTFAGPAGAGAAAEYPTPRTIAHYRILGKLGQGGMGAVYRAIDTKLGREVAIKVLPASFAEDADRMARFTREAKVLASLNHPNIAQIYGVEERALVMELVPGETLASLLKSGPLPLAATLNYSKQIAEALEAAHEKGIVHRDLKPANVVITPEGPHGSIVKLLDFGLASIAPVSASSDPLNSPTITMQATKAGIIMGTAPYMSPEQASGKSVDRRADIWSFGVVLWEMLTGRRLFEGDTLTQTLAEVLRGPIDFDQLPRETPAGIRGLLRRCLDRNANHRLRDIGEARIAIEAALAGKRPLDDAPSSPIRQGGDKRLWPGVAAVLVLALAALALLEWRRGQQSGGSPLTRLTMELAATEGLTPDAFGRPSSNAIAIAPDGNSVVLSALNPGVSLNPRILSSSRTAYPPSSFFKLYRRSLDQTETVAIPGTEGALSPFLNSDGQWVGFWADGKLKKVSLNGGPPFTICDAPTPGTRGLWGATWSSKDTIVFAAYAADLMQAPAKGGTPQVFLPRDQAKGELYSAPEFLPDGKTLLYTVRTSENWADAQIVARLDTGEQRVLIQGGADARYVPTGHLLYMENAVLMAVPFDARRVQLAGAPVAMLDGVMQAVNRPNRSFETGMGQFAASASGNLIYATGGIHPPYLKTLLRVDRNGKEAELNVPKGVYEAPRVSPDGRRLAVHKHLEGSRIPDIWVVDLLTGHGTRLTSEGTDLWPLWSPDGKRLLITGGPGQTQILSIAADGSGAPGIILTGKGRVVPASWSVDGKLAYLENRDRKYQILIRSMSRDGASEPFSDSKFNYQEAQVSPNGHWMAYFSNETGRNEVWVRPFPGPGEKYPISAGGGFNPMWARDQSELFYMGYEPSGNVGMMAVHIAPGAAFKFGQPRKLFEGDYETSIPMRSYDITPDGQHFIMLRNLPMPDQRVTKLTVVLNWFDELRRRAPTGKSWGRRSCRLSGVEPNWQATRSPAPRRSTAAPANATALSRAPSPTCPSRQPGSDPATSKTP